MRKCLKIYIRKIEKKKMMMWLNVSVATLNATLQLLVIYRLVLNPHNMRDHFTYY